MRWTDRRMIQHRTQNNFSARTEACGVEVFGFAAWSPLRCYGKRPPSQTILLHSFMAPNILRLMLLCPPVLWKQAPQHALDHNTEQDWMLRNPEQLGWQPQGWDKLAEGSTSSMRCLRALDLQSEDAKTSCFFAFAFVHLLLNFRCLCFRCLCCLWCFDFVFALFCFSCRCQICFGCLTSCGCSS